MIVEVKVQIVVRRLYESLIAYDIVLFGTRSLMSESRFVLRNSGFLDR
jgi:hypothetical protein